MLETRARGVQAKERSEFVTEQGYPDLAEVINEVYFKQSTDTVFYLLLAELRHWHGENGSLPSMDIPSEMYEDLKTLDVSIARWAVQWTCGIGDPHEGLIDLESEISICFESERERKGK